MLIDYRRFAGYKRLVRKYEAKGMPSEAIEARIRKIWRIELGVLFIVFLLFLLAWVLDFFLIFVFTIGAILSWIGIFLMARKQGAWYVLTRFSMFPLLLSVFAVQMILFDRDLYDLCLSRSFYLIVAIYVAGGVQGALYMRDVSRKTK